MIEYTIFAALLAVQTPAGAADPVPPNLTQENRAVIRCSAAFALVAARQARKDAATRQWPDLGERGREFFVVGLAAMMDEHQIDRETVARLVRDESERLHSAGEIDQIMPACLLMLESSGL